MSDNTTEPQPTEPQQPIEEAKPAKSQSTEASFYRRYRAVFIATILVVNECFPNVSPKHYSRLRLQL